MLNYIKSIFVVTIILMGLSLALAQTEQAESNEEQKLSPLSTTIETATEVPTEVPTEISSQTWFSVSSSIHYFIPSFEIHLGFEDALGDNLDIRATLSTFVIDGGGFVAGGLNGMKAVSSTDNRNSYIGFGPRILHLFTPNYDDVYEPSSYSQTFLGVGGFWSTEWFPQGSSRPFTEFNMSLPLFAIANDSGNVTSGVSPLIPVFSVSAGFNFYF